MGMAPSEEHLLRQFKDSWVFEVEREVVAKRELHQPSGRAVAGDRFPQDRPDDFGKVAQQLRQERLYEFIVVVPASNRHELLSE